jgi:hypothetical protein
MRSVPRQLSRLRHAASPASSSTPSAASQARAAHASRTAAAAALPSGSLNSAATALLRLNV